MPGAGLRLQKFYPQVAPPRQIRELLQAVQLLLLVGEAGCRAWGWGLQCFPRPGTEGHLALAQFLVQQWPSELQARGGHEGHACAAAEELHVRRYGMHGAVGLGAGGRVQLRLRRQLWALAGAQKLVPSDARGCMAAGGHALWRPRQINVGAVCQPGANAQRAWR